MITQRDHDFIVNLDQRGQKDLPDKSPEICADVFLNLLTHISKDHTIQYILVLIDDILSVSVYIKIHYEVWLATKLKHVNQTYAVLFGFHYFTNQKLCNGSSIHSLLSSFQEDKSRVKIFRESRFSGNVWQPFLNLLNRQDEFVQHMTARIIGKLACWYPQFMDKSDLHFYLSWLKDQLKTNVSVLLC